MSPWRGRPPRLRCMACGYTMPGDPWAFSCPRCGGLLEVDVAPSRESWEARRGRGVWRYEGLLPSPVEMVSMGEGGTPLVELPHLSSRTGATVYGKLEGLNPTGSFKDRGMTLAVSIAKSLGSRVVYAASTGNTAASAAAYAARAGMRAVLFTPKGGVARGKLGQLAMYGALVVEVEGSFDEALRIVLRVSRETGRGYPVNSFNQYRLEGQKTIAFEVVEELGVPDWVVVPVGNAGNIYAIWKGFVEAYRAGVIDRLPRMAGVQAEGASPLVEAYRTGVLRPVRPRTIASAIRIGAPINWTRALRAVRESGGVLESVSDAEIMEARRALSSREGLIVETASAASYAGASKLASRGLIRPGDRVVLVLTGNGLKEPELMEGGAETVRLSGPEEAGRLIETL